MPLKYVTGDPLRTQAQYLAFGYNGRGRTEQGDVESALMQRYAAPFASFRKLCRKQRIVPGENWLWYESHPNLIFMVIRSSSVGATRLRFVQSAALTLARDHALLGIKSMAVAPLGNAYEWPEIRLLLSQWWEKLPFPVIIYDEYQPGLQADEGVD